MRRSVLMGFVLMLMVASLVFGADLLTPRHDIDTLGRTGRSFARGYFTNLSIGGVDYIWPAADGTNGQIIKTDGSGTLSWTSAGAATAWDDLVSPDAAKTHAMTTFAQTFTSTKTDGDMFSFQGLGNFGNYSIVKIEQKTGNATDGTALTVISADAQVDALVVTANSVTTSVNADGTMTVGGALTVTGATTMTGSLTVNGAAMSGDGATVMSGFIRPIIAGGATGTYTLTIAESGSVFLTSQATEFDLPDAATGLEYTFVVGHASNVHIDPAAGDIILYGGCSAGDRLVSATVGHTITLVGVSATQWAVKSLIGTWTDDN